MGAFFCLVILQLVSICGFASSRRAELDKIDLYFQSIRSHTNFKIEDAEVYLKRSLEVRNEPASTVEEKIDALVIYASISGKICEKIRSLKAAEYGKKAFDAMTEAMRLDSRNCNANYGYGNMLKNVDNSFFSGIIASFLDINLRTEACKLVSDPSFRNCNHQALENQLRKICK